MTTKEKYDLAKWAMQTALEKGAQEVSVNIFSGVSSSVEVRDNKIDKLEQANQAGTVHQVNGRQKVFCALNKQAEQQG